MAITHGIKKYYSSFLGLNEIVDDITRDAGFATEAKNVRLLEDGALAKRRGYKIFADSEGGYGVLGFDNIDPNTGAITSEILVISDTIKRMKTATLTITNVNATGQDTTLSIAGDSSSGTSTTGWGSAGWGTFAWGDSAGRGFLFSLDVAQSVDNSGNEILPSETIVYYLGDEVENEGLVISALVSSLNSSPHLSASASGFTTTPAPFLDLLAGTTLAFGESVEITYYYTEEITKDSAAGFTNGFAAFQTSDDSVHIDTTIFNRSVYLTTGVDDLQQYDGHTLFKAGMTPGTIPTSTSAGAGVLTGDYSYRIQPWFKDHNNQIHLGAISNASSTLSLATEKADVVVTNIQSGNGFDARGALAAGIQSNSPVSGLVTLTVDDGSAGAHTVIAGDVIRLFNSDVATNAYAEYTVSSVTTSTIVVVSSVDIDLTDNVIISTGVFLDVYRTLTSGSSYQLVEQINNNPFSATQTYSDNTADSSLGARFIEPIRVPTLPPQARFVTTFNNSLVLGNSKTDPNKVFYSEPDEPTNFPVLNNFLAESNDGGVITALTQSNETLVIFRARSIFLMVGDFARNRINVTNLSSGGVGCVSHKSIVDINGIVFFLGERGVYTMAGAGIPKLISNPVIKSITTLRTATEEKLHFTRATAVHHVQDKQYIVYIPAETVLGGNRYANENSLCIVYNYVRDSWTQWENVNMSAGATYQDSHMWFSSRESRTTDAAVMNRVWRQHNDNEAHDYGDQLDPIEFKYGSGWESIGNPSTAKKFLRAKLHSYTDLDNPIPISAFTVNASTEIDYKEHTPHSSFSFVFPDRGSTWDSRPWDTFTWGGAQQPTYKTKLRKGLARSLRLVLENNEYDTNVVFTGFELEYAAPQGNTIKQ